MPLTNVHDEPTKSYQVNPQELTVKLAGRQLVGMHHSHPKGNTHTGEGFCPSEADMECQISWQVPFYVTVLGRANVYRDFFGWGDQLHVPPFRGREFRHGVTDCFALVRQVMGLVYGKTPPDFPRSMNWWDDPDADNPILAYFDQSGFEDIRFEDIQPGDGLIYTLGRGIPAHCAVYIGNDLLMHHLSGRLSKIDPVPTWRRQFYKAVRYAPGADTQPGERISGDRRKTEEGGTSRPLG